MNTTAKRFFKYTWQDPNFTSLSIKEKLLYKYIWESCDIAGVHQIHTGLMGALLGFEVDFKFIKSLIEKIDDFELIDGDRIWINSFIRFQQAETKKSLSTNPPHVSAVNHLKKAGIFQKAVNQDPELFINHLTDGLPLAKPYSSSISTKHKPSNGDSLGSGHSPIQSISESTNSSYSFCEGIVNEYFAVSDEETYSIVKELNKILKELEGKNMDKPDLHLELTIKELVEKFGQNDLTIELIRNTLGLHSSTVKT